MKNSSRLEAKIARNRTRSSSGREVSSASSSTRSLNASQLSSRSANRSAGSGSSSSGAGAGTGDPDSVSSAMCSAMCAPSWGSIAPREAAGAVARVRASVTSADAVAAANRPWPSRGRGRDAVMVPSWHRWMNGG